VTTIAITAKIINVVDVNWANFEIWSSNNPIKLRGGPGKTGTRHPIIPRIIAIIPKVRST